MQKQKSIISRNEKYCKKAGKSFEIRNEAKLPRKVSEWQ